MPDEQGNRINNGTNPTNNDILNALMSTLTTTFKNAFDDQNKILRDIRDKQKSTAASSGQLVDVFSRGYSKRITSADVTEQVEDLKDSLGRLITHTDSEIKRVERDTKKAIRTPESLGSSQQLSILNRYKQSIDSILSNIDSEFSSELQSIRNFEDKIRQLETKLQEQQSRVGQGTQEQQEELNRSILKTHADIEYTQNQIDDISRKIKDTTGERVEKATRERDRALEQQQRNIAKIVEAFGLVQQGNQDLASISSSYADLLQEQQKKESKESANEEFAKAVELQKDTLTKYLRVITKKLEEDTDLSEDEKKYLKQQQKLTKDQIEYLKKLNPTTEIWKQAGKDIKQVGKDLLSGLFKDTLSILKNRFLESYEKGFQNVYNSLESTRNTISARMGLNQGAFEDLINDLQKDISEQGLEGVMSVVDLQEALVSLSSAGISDKELLKDLTLEMSKLKAQGSSLDLGNEETLGRIVSLLQQGKTSDEIVQFLDTAAAQERVIREEYGDTALVHGGMNQIMNQILDMGSAYNKSMEDISKDLGESLYASQQLSRNMVPTDTLLSTINNLIQKSPDQLSDFEKVVYTQYQKDIASGDIVSAYENIAKSMYNIVKDVDRTYLPSVMNTYGLNMTTTEAMRLRQGANGSISGLPADFSDKVSQTIVNTQKELQEASWVSTTEKVINEAENTMTDAAQFAETFYEGDQAVLKIAHGIEDKVGQIINILIASIGKSLVSGDTSSILGRAGNVLQRGATAATQKLSSLPIGSFLTGGLKGGAGQAATIGKGLGVVTGVGIAGYNIAQDLIDGKGIEGVLTDSSVYTGIGTALGSAIAGPLGGVVGGVVYKGAAELGNYLGKTLGDLVFPDVTNFDRAVMALQESSTELYNAATSQLDVVSAQETTFKNFDTSQQKLYLLQNGNITAEQANNKTDSEINDLFKQYVIEGIEQERKKAELEVQKQAFVKDNADKLLQVQNDFADISKLDTSIESDSGSSQVERAITARLGKENASSLISMISESGADSKEVIASMTEGMGLTEEQQGMYVQYVEGILDRKKAYDEANEKFHDKWKRAEAASDKKDFVSIFAKYSQMFAKDMTTSTPSINWNEDGSSPILVDGLPNLNDADGLYYTSKYLGKFKSGLTRVPNDNYPALLHEGERVLTKKESDVYNEMSSYGK